MIFQDMRGAWRPGFKDDGTTKDVWCACGSEWIFAVDCLGGGTWVGFTALFDLYIAADADHLVRGCGFIGGVKACFYWEGLNQCGSVDGQLYVGFVAGLSACLAAVFC